MQNRTTSIVTAPASEPVSQAEAKLFLKVDGNDDNDLIDSLIITARQMAESYCRATFVTTTLKLTADGFPYGRMKEKYMEGIHQVPVSEAYGQHDTIWLENRPLQSVTSITTYDSNNSGTVFASSNYTVDTANGRINLNDGASWPTSLRDHSAVEVVYVAGYGAASDVPDAIKTAMKMHIAKMYDERMACGLPDGCMALLDQYKTWDRLAAHG